MVGHTLTIIKRRVSVDCLQAFFFSHKWIEPNIVGSYSSFDEIVENTADV
jgi:hypothetical protein